MVIDLVRSVGSANVCFRINERNVLQTLREQLKVPGSRLEGSELLTSEFLRFRSRLNETSGGLGKIGAFSGSDCRILKFLRTTFLAAKLLGWKVSVKGIRSSLSEADGFKADSLFQMKSQFNTVEPRYNEVPRDRTIYFVTKGVRYKRDPIQRIY